MNDVAAPAALARRFSSALLTGALLALLPPASLAQPVVPAPAVNPDGLAPLEEVDLLETPPVDAPALTMASRAGIGAGEPLRFAEPYAVDVAPGSRGRWEIVDGGRTAVWRLRVVSEGAVSLNLGFSRYRMPAGGSLRVYAPAGDEVLGPFTEADNEAHGELWTPVLSGGEAVIEAAVPAERSGELALVLGSVNRGFRDLAPSRVAQPGHASCHIDVACSIADPYRDQVRSVARYTIGGVNSCSGALINNTARDGRPLLVTAHHCVYSNTRAASVVVYWNYQSPVCGNRSGGSEEQSQSGAKLLYTDRGSSYDFSLLELDDPVDRGMDAYFAGWNRDTALPASTFTFHHPGGHVKSFNADDEPPSLVNGALRVDWDRGGVEGGSSGAPLFGPDKRIVGTLFGGVHFPCVHPRRSYSARLATVWTRGAKLRELLDPLGTGATAIDGLEGSNLPPRAVGALDAKALRFVEGEPPVSLTVDVARGFVDPEGDELSYGVSSSDDAIVSASVSGSTVTLAPAAAGAATVTVKATAVTGWGTPASHSFGVTVGANRSPEPVGALASLPLDIDDGAGTVDIASAFTDADGDALTYGASSAHASLATVSLSGSTVTVTPLSGGTAKITVTATDVDGSGTTARRSFDAVVASRPPSAEGALPALSIANRVAGEGDAGVELSGAFRDPDGDVLTYGVSSSEEGVATARPVGSEAVVRPVSVGTTTITATATDVDGSNTAATQTFDVTVTNGPPSAVGDPSPNWFWRHSGARSWDLAPWFADPDGDGLSYGASSSNEAVAVASVSGAELTATPSGFGTATITATARDEGGAGLTASQSFEVTFRNVPPSIMRTIPQLELSKADGAGTWDLSEWIRDLDGDVITWGAAPVDPAVVRASVSDSMLTVTPVAVGSTVIRLTATDRGGSNTMSRPNLRARVVNSPPSVPDPAPVLELRKVDGARSWNLSAWFVDADGDRVTYEASSPDPAVARMSLSGSTLTVTPVAAGSTAITVRATDRGGSGTATTGVLGVTVRNSPPAPVGTLPDVLARQRDGDRAIGLAGAFSDADGDALGYEAASSDEAVATAAVSGSTLTLAPGAAGVTTISVTARDVGGSNAEARQSFVYRLLGVCPAPLGALPTLRMRVGEPDRAVDLVGAFLDPEDAPLTWSASSSNDGVAAWAGSSPQGIFISARSPGRATISVAASNAACAESPEVQRFDVVVGPARGLDLSPALLSVEEGTTSSYTVALSAAPAGGPVTVTPSAPPSVSLSPAALIFTLANWDVPREVFVEALHDPDDRGETLTITHRVVGGDYDPSSLRVTIEDDEEDDSVVATFGADSYEVFEGASVRIVVRLDRDPGRDLSFDVLATPHGGASPADYSLVPASVPFAAGVTRRELLFTAEDDAEDDDGEAVVLSFGGLPSGVTGDASTTVAIIDDDGPAAPGGGGGPPPGDPGGGGGGPPPGDSGGGGGDGGPPPGDSDGGGGNGGGGGGPPRASIGTDADCAGAFCRARTGARVSFRDASGGTVRTRRWDFGDGGRPRGASVSHSWSEPGFYEVTLWTSDGSVESTASLTFLVEASDPAGGCVANAETLCLRDSRYAVTVDWWREGGGYADHDHGVVVHAGTNDSGLFRFFDAANWEVLIKVLDGCARNGHAWVFGASTTDLGYLIRVRDTVTGAVREYRNEPGVRAPAITDATAFPASCVR